MERRRRRPRMKLTRVTWSREQSGKFMVETGELQKLTPEEEKELDSLRLQLEQYGDFLNLGDVPQEEMDELFKAKARRGELEDRSRAQITWTAKPEDEVRSIVLVLQPLMLPTYVENLPNKWIDKIFDPAIYRLPSPTGKEESEKETQPLIPPSLDLGEQIRECLLEIEGTPTFKDAKTYLDCVTIEEVESRPGQPASHFKIMPKKYLEDDWKPINNKLGDVFKQKLTWTRDSKNSHWKVWK